MKNRAFVSIFDRAFVSVLTELSYRLYRAFVPRLLGFRNVKAVGVIASQMLLTEFVLRLVFYQNYNEKSSRAEGENRKIDA